jgi:hypothetical protein
MWIAFGQIQRRRRGSAKRNNYNGLKVKVLISRR